MLLPAVSQSLKISLDRATQAVKVGFMFLWGSFMFNDTSRAFLLVFAGIVLALPAAALEKSAVAEAAAVYIISPVNGAVVSSPVSVRFGLVGMGVAPAGISFNNTGHHHLLIDMDQLPSLDAPLPATEQLRHFGKGQTETLVELKPGVHTLQLLMGNHLHVPHDRAVVSEKITITVR
jgi:hypothetical protein